MFEAAEISYTLRVKITSTLYYKSVHIAAIFNYSESDGIRRSTFKKDLLLLEDATIPTIVGEQWTLTFYLN